MSALRTTGLSKSYGRKPALRDCTVDLPEGKVIGLVGSNGGGKSTFLALAAGLIRPTTGQVRVFGDEVRGRLHPDAAYLPQHRPLHEDFTIAEMIRAVGAMNERWSPERVEEALAAHPEVDRGSRVRSLSQGMRTQLALALCLGRLPKLLLLDEPMSDLDPLAREEFLRLLLADVAERGMTVVLSSHSLGELRDVCDHLMLLHVGEVLLNGDVEEILDDHLDVVGPADDGSSVTGTVICTRRTGRQQRSLVRAPGALAAGWEGRRPELEGLVTDYLRARRVG
ncbi:ABC-2 type transport system ATP-binding protein [Saccharopolyspora antimicrobica]|uniref:ABC-2 type transport system ATP-binding protein n=1 Tax=Saccharopolyspora antimicrobica TaxID=455193 RepID=A0A1I5B6I7_9PSEU|nr:ABC transporter ATP-binding protein [Saccharopolyspora antimicrobica]RKT86481.1 ABC-2 type transport system ATP-binding protein [Saccharopolyspora antimicrobica]SFN70230.1 ABC-2 type transport system ATP-binding protein [Saccharopolyspora antimicrobica]